MFYTEHLIDIVEELLLEHLIRLPRAIYTGHEVQQASYFSQLKCFMILLYEQKRLQVTLSNDDAIEKLLHILLSAVELEKSNNLVEICSDVWHIDDQKIAHSLFASSYGIGKRPWKIYKNINNHKIIDDIKIVCEYLTKHQHVYVFVLEFICERFLKNSDKCNEVLIITQMLLSNPCKLTDTCSSLHTLILENLLCEYRWNLVTDTVELSNIDINYKTDQVEGNRVDESVNIRERLLHQEIEIISSKKIKNNILHSCLTIETVGLYAKQQRQRHNEMYIMKSLQYIIEKSASKNYMIRVSAFGALENMRLAHNLNTITELMHINTDYLIHSVEKSLAQPNCIDKAIHTLKNTLQSETTLSQSNLESIISTLITESSKKSQSANSLPFIYAFKMILSTMHSTSTKCTTDLCNIKVGSFDKVRNRHNHFDVWTRFLHAVRISKLNSNHNTHVINNQSNQSTIYMHQEVRNDDKQMFTRLAAIILKQVVPYLTSKRMEIKMVTLHTISIGLDIIKDNENELLPTIHLMWNVLIAQCFQNNNKTLLPYGFQVITKLSKYAQQFVKKRFLR